MQVLGERGLDWFEVTEIRGHIEDGAMPHHQVSMKVGVRLKDPHLSEEDAEVVTSVESAEPFPSWFFDRDDPAPDDRFYAPSRLVTHIDDGAIAAVGDLYAELGVDGSAPQPRRVLDLMSSWVSHLRTAPTELVVVGMNGRELDANRMATERLVQDLNVDPRLPFPDGSFDAVLCCVSVDYLTRPVEVLAEAARVLRPGAPVVITFSNRCFPTKAIHGWLATDDAGRGSIVVEYLRRTGRFTPADLSLCTPGERRYRGDPLYAAVARRLSV